MAKAYVVTSGEYSDYKICGVCSTRENAEIMKTRWPGSDIEEYELDDEIQDGPQGLLPYQAFVNGSGEIIRCRQLDWCRGKFISDRPVYFSSYYSPEQEKDRFGMVWDAWARNAEHMTKIASERWLQAAAMGLTPTSIEDAKRRRAVQFLTELAVRHGFDGVLCDIAYDESNKQWLCFVQCDLPESMQQRDDQKILIRNNGKTLRDVEFSATRLIDTAAEKFLAKKEVANG